MNKQTYNKEYYQRNRGRFIKNWKKYYEKNKDIINERVKGYKLKWRYGITTVDVDRMKQAQEGLCAICRCEKILVVDHDHLTGKVRGLLCQDCNKGLGMFNDSSLNLRNAIVYLAGSYWNDDKKDYTIATNWSLTH